jgi:thiol-disulfide isomerase/thioredoxin
MKTSFYITFIATIALGLFIASHAACQNKEAFVFEGSIDGLDGEKLILNRLQGHREHTVQEFAADQTGSFSVQPDQSLPQGQYRLRIDPAGRNGILEFLLTGGNIRFSTHIDYLIDSIEFEKSEINQAWYNYFGIKEKYETRLSILEQLLGMYPRDERFYPNIIKEFNLLQDELEAEVDEIVSRHSNSLLARYIRSDQSPRINPAAPAAERQEFLRNNYLNHVDFSDTLLLNTDIFPNKALSYIMLFRSQGLNREQQAQEFIAATDYLLPLSMADPRVFNYLLDYTISGFEQIGMEQVLTYIADNYSIDESCVSDQDSGELQRRMEGYRKLAPGNPAPGINTQDILGKDFRLSEVNADKVLIVFWASWCPHCTAMLPDIKALAINANANNEQGKAPRLKVVSVSIDHSEQDYTEYLEKHDMKSEDIGDFWVNICDFEAWEGQVADDYYLYATPTMILLDQDHNIAAKPATVNELVKASGF